MASFWDDNRVLWGALAVVGILVIANINGVFDETLPPTITECQARCIFGEEYVKTFTGRVFTASHGKGAEEGPEFTVDLEVDIEKSRVTNKGIPKLVLVGKSDDKTVTCTPRPENAGGWDLAIDDTDVKYIIDMKGYVPGDNMIIKDGEQPEDGDDQDPAQ